MIDIGSQVYVQWYNSVLQGEVVANTTPNDRLLGSMVAVRIPIQGSHAVALFAPSHVYLSVDKLAQQKKELPTTAVVPVAVKPQESLPTTPEAWQRIQAFKKEHWDANRNRLCLEAQEEFYEMWRDAVAEKVGCRKKPDVLAASTLAVPKPKQTIRKQPKKIIQLSLTF